LAIGNNATKISTQLSVLECAFKINLGKYPCDSEVNFLNNHQPVFHMEELYTLMSSAQEFRFLRTLFSNCAVF
jgi:hypothetical protein